MGVFLVNRVRFAFTRQLQLCRLVFFGRFAVVGRSGEQTPAPDNERLFVTIRSSSRLAAFE